MRVNLLGAWIDALNMDEVEERLAGFIRTGDPHQVITLNPEMLYRAQQEPELLNLINGASLVTADGTGIVWAARMAGKPVPERVTGIDLMLRMVARSAKEGWRIFLLGGAPGVAKEAARRLQQRYPQLIVAGTYHGYFQESGHTGLEEKLSLAPGAEFKEDTQDNLCEAQLINIIRRARPHLFFAGLGAPKQEKFIARNLKLMQVPVAIGVGGSFDVIAGKVSRAPIWMQRLHIEWLGRLMREPWRWRRMMVLPRFAWRVMREVRKR
ncbi:MAG: WecB/TagA/CpsF family glycosyltransferase [Firmicutes bacterium]|nr:WecB/TagA/CpsF family glycosyltransferase [Bacillota bacterium]